MISKISFVFENINLHLIKKITILILGLLSIAIWITYLYVVKNFGTELTVEQVLWTAENSLSGLAQSFIKSLIKYICFAVVASVLWILFVFKLDKILFLLFKKQSFSQKIFKSFAHTFLILLSACILFAAIYKADDTYGLISYYELQQEARNNDFIGKEYSVPRIDEISFSKKRNVVLIMGESLESKFNSDFSVTPEIDSLVNKYAKADLRLVNTNGSNWTVAALTSWHFGLPLKLPVDGNHYYSRRGFLPNAQSVFDVLKAKGYKLYLVMGSLKLFSGIGALFTTHGNFEVLDLGHWKEHDYFLPEDKAIDWGYSDAFVMDRAKELYNSLINKGEPFVMIVQTIDTHFPDGFCPEDKKKFNDVRDAYLESDRQIAGFVNYLISDNRDNLVVGIIGDHNFMGSHSIFNLEQREIRCSFFGDVPLMPKEKADQYIGAVDIAPTILEVAGAKWNSSVYGLGRSVFSKDSSLVYELTLDRYNKLINYPSSLYQSFY